MRVLFFSRFLSFALITALGSSLAIGSISIAWSGTARAADAGDKKIERLGFTFDHKTHDAAVASAAARAAGDSDISDTAPFGVVRLPKYTVTDERVRLEERELLTPKGRREVAVKRYLNPMYQKTLGPVIAVATFILNPLGGWDPNTPEAMRLYENDEQKRRNTEMNDLNDLAALSASLEKKPPATKKPKKSSK